MSAMNELDKFKRVVPAGLVTAAMLVALVAPWAKGNGAAATMCRGTLDRVLLVRYGITTEVTMHIGYRADNGEPFVAFKARDGKYKKVCISALVKMLQRELQYGHSAGRPITWNAAMEEFLTRCSRGSENRNGRPKSRQEQWHDESVLRRLAARFSGRPVHATSYADLRAYLSEREQQQAKNRQTPYARATVNREVAVITRFFNFMEAEEHVDRNPARRLKQGKACNVRSHMAPSVQELKAWRESIPPERQEVRDFFDIAVNTGMRASEILGLRPEYYRLRSRCSFCPTRRNSVRPASR
jgi:hypothetical protein